MKAKELKSGVFDLTAGIVTGFVNGMFGAGGGMIAVPFLLKKGFDQKDAQRNTIAVILPISLLSASIYIIKGEVGVSDALPYLPTGILGAVTGTYIMSKISPKLLKGIFGGFMIYAGIRLLIR